MLNILGVALNSVLIIITIIVIGWVLSTQKYTSKQNFWLLVQDTILIMIAIIICFLFSMSFSYFFRIPKKRRSLFVNGFVNANTLFAGLPLNLALFGEKKFTLFFGLLCR